MHVCMSVLKHRSPSTDVLLPRVRMEIDRQARRTEAAKSTDLIPLPHAVGFLEEPLVMRYAVLAVDEATRRGHVRRQQWVRVNVRRARTNDVCSGSGDSREGSDPRGTDGASYPAIAEVVLCGASDA